MKIDGISMVIYTYKPMNTNKFLQWHRKCSQGSRRLATMFNVCGARVTATDAKHKERTERIRQ
jgi:hypothetical protein